ncbi:MAG: hypothetical protein ACF8SC_09110 [Phycisphaerales bacterium JB037]
MSVVLTRDADELLLNNRGWATLLRLAWDYGWRPRGTLPPPHWTTPELRLKAAEWNGADYVTCRGQIVTAPDAQRLAEALRAVADDLSPEDPDPAHDEQLGLRRVPMPGYPPVAFLSDARPMSPFEFFGGSNRAGFHRFVSFCQGGAFAIW